MADSTLDPGLVIPARTRQERGTAALGPSGTSDSGSDLHDDAGAARDIAPDRIIGSELPMRADALDRIEVDDTAPADESGEPPHRERAHRR